jgi:Tfp pilus assembly protein PilX
VTASHRSPRAEGGFALIAALIVLVVILMLGLVTLSFVDVQSHQARSERNAEDAFNLAESALSSESDHIATKWPGALATALPLCTQSSTPSATCSGTALASNFSSSDAGVDFGATPQWSVQVVDDTGGPSYYADSIAQTAQAWDANADNAIWLRAQATVGGRKAIVVAQVLRQKQAVNLPNNAITAGGVYTSNNGNKVIIEGKDPVSGLTGLVATRCGSGSSTPVYGDPCLGWDPSKGQLDPPADYQGGYVDPNGGYTALPASTLAAIKEDAISQGTYYNGTCPPNTNAGWSGLVWVDNASCIINSNVNIDSATSPGAIFFGTGTLEFNATINMWGIVYMANQQGTVPTSGPCTATQQQAESEPVMTVHGNGTLYGAIFVDGCGEVDGGSSAYNIQFTSNAFGGVRTFSTPYLAKNSFRIVPNP